MRKLALLFGSLVWAGFAVSVDFGTASGPGLPTCHGQEATVLGTAGRDVYRWDADLENGDVLVLGVGDDLVVNPPVRITVCGGAGRDHLEAGGETGKAILDGGRGRDVVGSPDDEEDRTNSLLIVYGGPGADRLYGGTGHPGPVNVLRAGAGDDAVFGFFAEELIRGAGGNDKLEGGGEKDRLFGGNGNDRLTGDDATQGLQARDFANGGAGRDECAAEVVVDCEL